MLILKTITIGSWTVLEFEECDMQVQLEGWVVSDLQHTVNI